MTKGTNVATIITRYIFDDYGDHWCDNWQVCKVQWVYSWSKVWCRPLWWSPWEHFNRDFQSCLSIFIFIYIGPSRRNSKESSIFLSKKWLFFKYYRLFNESIAIFGTIFFNPLHSKQRAHTCILLHFFCRFSFPTASRWLVLDKSASGSAVTSIKSNWCRANSLSVPSMMRIYDVAAACWLL